MIREKDQNKMAILASRHSGEPDLPDCSDFAPSYSGCQKY
jgi:hypothetical protein